MAETIETMLAISRIESGKLQPVRSLLFLHTLLAEVAEAEQEEIARKGHALTLECAEDLHIASDAHFLKEVLGNLLQNAIKYTPPGGSIALRARQEGGAIHLDVQDTGYGIPRHQQPLIFRKFFRAENVASHVTEGSGLGLYLASLMTELLGGQISFVSEEGKGSTFTLTLPSAETGTGA